ncbi:MAG TPA: hypothetical protein VK540_35610 [Polyangiaceae bacterium]|nr:hypothetical protein [Polyangiaceae bacterium]
MWVLQLNLMRDRCESRTPLACATTREALERFVANERVEPYDEPGDSAFGGTTTWRKVFRKGGTLEWFNPPEDARPFFEPFVDIGTAEDWVAGALARFHETTSALRRVD